MKESGMHRRISGGQSKQKATNKPACDHYILLNDFTTLYETYGIS